MYVYLDLSQDMSQPESQEHHEALVEELRERAHYLRSVLNEERDARRRVDMIIAQLTRANAALAARARAGASAGFVGKPGDGQRPRDTAEFPVRGRLLRPWWRRVVGG